MGRKSKTGKSRKDKFYHLAKETGYRARSAFKLIQLNRKFEFLQKSRVVIDLCAAPGGWLQVVAENTPISSLIVGVDLVPIKPVKNCVTLQEDITTDKCRQSLKRELQTWKADAVLHDGAPNVGKNWLLDAFSQNQLTLQSLKLATEFLRKGGWFVTKIFRSKDYYSLMWVFQQLFKNVHATKPQASRNESAEIFVVCEKFLAPDKIDPKFMDPKYVFKEVEEEPTQSINLIHPQKKRRQREGYAEGDYTLFHTLKASEFISSDNYLNLLANCNQVTIDTDVIANHKETTKEIKECLKDIKVLGKADIRSLINWRKKLKKDLERDQKAQRKTSKEAQAESKDSDSDSDDKEDKDEETKLLESVAIMEEDERKALKRKLKKIRRQKAKLQHKMDMKMVIPGDRHEFSDDIGLFNLGKIKNKKQLDTVDTGDTTEADQMALEEEEGNEQEEQFFGKAFRKRQTYDRDNKGYLDDEISLEGSWEEEPEFHQDSEEEMEFEEDIEENPLVMSLEDKSSSVNRKSMSWFSKDSFAGLEDNDEDDESNEDNISDDEMTVNEQNVKEHRGKMTESNDVTKQDGHYQDSDQTIIDKCSDEDGSSSDESSDDNEDDSDSDYDVNKLYSSNTNSKQNSRKEKSKASSAKEGFEVVPAGTGQNLPKLDAVGLAIGTQLVQSRKRRREIIEDSYHRYMFNDQNLPDWFVKDEAKHCKRQLPVTRGDIEEYKLKMKAIDARPIKKIAEAKARKKKKEVRRLERARKKAEVISDTADISDRDKWQQIKQVYKKAGLLSQKKKEITYVVAKKGVGKRVRRPNGVQGPFRVVDPRMKKDNRAAKRQAKEKGKKGKSKRGKSTPKGGQR